MRDTNDLIKINAIYICNYYNLKMMHAVASKRRLINVISLSFVLKLFSKKFLTKKYSNWLGKCMN